jgi:hypothetical protein
LACKVKNGVRLKTLNDSRDVILVANVAMLKGELALRLQPSQIVTRTVSVKVVKDDQVVST